MINISLAADKIVEFMQNNWHRKKGLFSLLIFAFLVTLSFVIAIQAPVYISMIIMSVTEIIVFIGWLYAKKIPRTARGKVGFVVCIACSTSDEEKKIHEDFIIPLRQLISTGRTGKAFHFIEMPQFIARSIIVQDDAIELRIKCKAHFMLYGRIRLRELNGTMQHFIDLEGAVTHRPISKEFSKSFADEFAELLPRKIGIPLENDLLTFQFTSEWAIIVAKYIIGIAAAYSGDLDYAESLYSDSLEQLKEKDHGFAVYAKLIQRIPKRISELYEVRARASYKRWEKSHAAGDIAKVGENLSKIGEAQKTKPGVVNLRAINLFLKDRDAKGAIQLLKKSAEKNNAIWHLNLAFLFAYVNDLKNALRHYKRAITFPIGSETIAEIEEFICLIIDEEPKKNQLFFCLGFINWKIKGDRKQAIKDFKKFLVEGKDGEFVQEKELVKSWIETIKTTREI